jgi:AcrR family transcriptional regulator
MTSATDSYHHGDLPNALRSAAAAVIAERGVGAFSLREVARRAGVSHTAPAHHFGDVRGLLTSLAAEGFERLAAATQAAVDRHPDPAEQLEAIGRAYVAVAQEYPAHFQVMFRTDIVDQDDPALLVSGLRAYGVVEGALQRLIEAEHLSVDLDTATWLCWSASQGLVQLDPKIEVVNDRKGNPPTSADEIMGRFARLMLDGLRRG